MTVSGVRLNLLQWLTRSRLGSKNNSLREWVVIASWANTVIIFNKSNEEMMTSFIELIILKALLETSFQQK